MNRKDKKEAEVSFPWTVEQEELLAEWSEKATCYRWLHSRSEKSYRAKNYLFTIPVIILSTLTGTANFAMDSFVPEEHKQIAMAAVGSVNIFAGILSTLQNFLRYAELMESHRLSEVQWSKFGRNIAVELALDPKRRKPAHDFLKISRAEYDRLIEQSPTIDDSIIKQFKSTFKKTLVRVPDTCNGLHPCKIYERSEEEKMEEIMANAGKLLSQRKAKKWESVMPKIKDASHSIKHTDAKHESKKEIDALHSMSRVSAFHKKINSQTAEPDKPLNPIDEIHALIPKSEESSVSIEIPEIDDLQADNEPEPLKDEDKDDKADEDNNDKEDEDKDDSEETSSETAEFLKGIQ